MFAFCLTCLKLFEKLITLRKFIRKKKPSEPLCLSLFTVSTVLLISYTINAHMISKVKAAVRPAMKLAGVQTICGCSNGFYKNLPLNTDS